MGIDREDCNVLGHAQETGPLEAFDNLHFGDQNINDTSSNIGIAGRAALIQAASTQSAFDSAAATIHGSWYTSKPTAYKIACFRWHHALKDELQI